MARNLLHDDACWRAENDARTLAEADAISMDSKRLAAARKAAKRQYADAMKSAESLKRTGGGASKGKGRK